MRNQRNAFWVVREVQKMNQPKTQITQAKINRGKKTTLDVGMGQGERIQLHTDCPPVCQAPCVSFKEATRGLRLILDIHR